MMQIKLEKFEGPLGLLLKLIEKEELDITEISLAKIADQYIERIKAMANICPEETSDFLVVAAKLLLIKSKAILPYLSPTEEDEIDEFEQQLKMYKEFLDAAKKIEKIIGKKKFAFVRDTSKINRKYILNQVDFFSPPKKLTKEELSLIFQNLVSNIKIPEQLEEKKLEPTINIEDKIIALEKMLIEHLKLSFNKILSEAKSKTEIIVSFLAMLELIKQRQAVAAQDDLFGEIIINKNSV